MDELSADMRAFEQLIGASTDLAGVIQHVQFLVDKADCFRERIVSAYRRIAFRLAKKHSPADGSHLIDNFQNGCIGLIKAVSYYDPAKKTRFSKYAETWIRQSMLLHLKETSNFVRIAPQSWSHLRQFERIAEKLEMRHGPSGVTDENIAVQYLLNNGEEIDSKSVKKTVEKIATLRNQTRVAYVRSLDYSYDEDGTPIIDKIPDDSSEEQDSSLNISYSGLSEKERRWIFMLFGNMTRLRKSVRKSLVLEEQLRQRHIASL